VAMLTLSLLALMVEPAAPLLLQSLARGGATPASSCAPLQSSHRRCGRVRAEEAAPEPVDDDAEEVPSADGADGTAPEVSAKAAVKAEKEALRNEIAELEQALKIARGELIDKQDAVKDAGENGYLIVAANFETFRQKARKELSGQAEFGKIAGMRPLLTFFDTFDELQAGAESASEGEAQIHKFYAGIHKQLQGVIAKLQVEPFITTAGEPFDSVSHQLTAEEETTEVAPGIVLECTARGYTMAGQMLRGAGCIVSKAPEPEPEPEPALEAEGFEGDAVEASAEEGLEAEEGTA